MQTGRGWHAARIGLCLAAFFATSAEGTPIRTLLIGDSITAGTVGDDAGAPYADLTAARLPAKFDVVNLGQGGSSTPYWVPGTPCFPICPSTGSLYSNLVEPELPADIATILLGANDALGLLLNTPTDKASYEANLRDLADALFQSGIRDVLVMTPARFASDAWDEAFEGYRDGVLAVAADDDRIHLGPDLFTLIDPALDYAPDDSIHPSAAGHEKISAALVAALIELPEPGTGVLLVLGALVAVRGSRRRPSRPIARA
jgi:lysophospholipase L1-like esterase